MQQAQPIEGITPDMLWTFFVVLVGIGALTGDTPPAADTVTISRDELAQQRHKLEEVTAWINARLEV